ncbi:MAG: hypothetical protein KJ559_04175 [Nanoarchaeota archaeon]|nr:hypothetical protein [Nanoarchaeota archaeon]
MDGARIETYSRKYGGLLGDINRVMGAKEGDTIINDLCNHCIYLGVEKIKEIEKERFLWWDKKQQNLILVAVFEKTCEPAADYIKFVQLQIMPSSESFPKDLTRLLEEKGFKQK